MIEGIRLRRFGAIVLDFIFMAIISLFVSQVLAVFGLLNMNLEDLSFDKFYDTYVITLISGTIIAVIYFSILPIFFRGASFGKLICNITVYNNDGSKVEPFKLFTRNMQAILALITLGSFIASPKYMHYILTTPEDLVDNNYLLTLITPLGSLLMLLLMALSLIMLITILTSRGYRAFNDILAGTRVDYLDPEKVEASLVRQRPTRRSLKEEKHDEYDRPDLSHFGNNNPPSEDEE